MAIIGFVLHLGNYSLCSHVQYYFNDYLSFCLADMANIVLLLVIIMLVFSVIGVTLFRDVVPKYFGNLSSCILLSFPLS